MRAGDAAPNDTNAGTVDGTLGTVNVSDALAEVEVGVLGGTDALELEEGGVLLGVALGAGEAENTAFGVEPGLWEGA